jgi:hypothetical protein
MERPTEVHYDLFEGYPWRDIWRNMFCNLTYRSREITLFRATTATNFGVFLFLCLVSWGGVRLSPLGTSVTNWPIVPAPDECGAVGGMRIGKGNRSIRRKPAPVPLCQPQIPHDLTWIRIRVTAVGSRQLTASAMPRP